MATTAETPSGNAYQFPILEGARLIDSYYSNGGSPRDLDKFGNTPLYYVRNTDDLRLLINKGIDVNSVNLDGKTVLDVAIAVNGRRSELVAVLETNGARTSKQLIDDRKRQADLEIDGVETTGPKYKRVRTFSSSAEVQIAKFIIREWFGRNPDNAKKYDFSPDSNGQTILHKLSSFPLQEAKRIVTQGKREGVDFNSPNMNGQTPLHVVTAVEYAGLLLDAGAGLNRRDINGNTPFHVASNSPSLIAFYLERDKTSALVKNNDKATMLHRTRSGEVVATVAKEPEVFKEMIGSEDGLGRRPIHVAKNVEVSRALVEHGAEAGARSSMGFTALHFARDAEMVVFLKGQGLNLDDQANQHQKTPLHVVETEGAAKALLDLGANPEARDKNLATPLHTASSLGVAKVLGKVADLQSEAYGDLRTPLISLVAGGVIDKEVAQLFKERLPGIGNQKNQYKEGVLHYARSVEQVDTLLAVLSPPVERSLFGRLPSENVKDELTKAKLATVEKQHFAQRSNDRQMDLRGHDLVL